MIILCWRTGPVGVKQTFTFGVLAAVAIGHSGFLGSFFALWAGLCFVLLPEAGGTKFVRRLGHGALFSLPIITAIAAYTWWFQMVGASVPLMLQPAKPLLDNPVGFLGLNFGLGLIGLFAILHYRRINRPSLILAALSLAVVGGISVPDWGSDVAVKVGYMAALGLALLSGMLFNQLRGRWLRLTASAVGALGMAAGLCTMALEVWNFSDIANPRFTSYLQPWDKAGYVWLRENTPPSAIVQKGPRADVRSAPFSPIPTFAQRHTYLGDWMHASIFLLSRDQYEQRKQLVEGVFRSHSADEAHRLCAIADIDYLFWGQQEYEDYGSPAAILSHPDLFEPVFNTQRLWIFRAR